MKNIIKKALVPVMVIVVVLLQAFPAFAAKAPCVIQIDDYKTRDIFSYSYSIDKDVDASTGTESNPVAGVLTIKMKSLNDGTPDMMSYLVEKNTQKNGEIIVNNTKTGNVMRTIEFKNAICVGYEEKYDKNIGAYEEVKLDCGQIIFGDSTFDNNYATTVSEESQGNPTLAIAIGAAIVAVGVVAVIVVKKTKKVKE